MSSNSERGRLIYKPKMRMGGEMTSKKGQITQLLVFLMILVISVLLIIGEASGVVVPELEIATFFGIDIALLGLGSFLIILLTLGWDIGDSAYDMPWSELEEIISGLSLGWAIASFTADIRGGDNP